MKTNKKSNFIFSFDSSGTKIQSLYYGKDSSQLNFIASDKGKNLGSYEIKYSFQDEEKIFTESSDRNLKVISRFERTNDDKLMWKLHITNTSEKSLRLNSIAIPLQMNTDYVKKADINYTKRLIRHSYVAQNGSFIYWQRPDGTFPALVMTCGKDTGLVDYDHTEKDKVDGWSGTYYVYIVSEHSWDFLEQVQPLLVPGQEQEYSMAFQWAENYQQIRELLYDNGKPDVISATGMVIPKGMDCYLGVRVKGEYDLVCEENIICQRQDSDSLYDIYKISFTNNGRHIIRIEYDSGTSFLCYFSTESVGELLRLRTKHICERQQYRGEKWFDGLISLWNMEKEHMLTPEQTDGIQPYCTGGADDPGLCKASIIAAKNCYDPDEKEIETIEYYIRNFLWGGLQRKEDENPYPYGIYGSDFWYDNRNSNTGYNNGGHGMERVWRSFDYTHIIGLYRDMYRIARQYPEKVKYLDWTGYLLRAYHTAIAFFEVPYSIFMKDGWDFTGYTDWAYKQGNFHEINIPFLIEELKKEGYEKETKVLRNYWEQKVMYMTTIHPYPFGSEMWFDTTAFESSHAITKYGVEKNFSDNITFYDKNLYGPGKGGEIKFPKVDKKEFLSFMKREVHANIASRDCMTPYCFQMGSDIRAGGDNQYLLSYMSQLGAWGILDYALNYCESNQSFYMRVGYASYLSSFMLINTGKNYPWYPSELNKGAAGWAFEPERKANTWLDMGKAVERAPWPLDGEIDNGFLGAMRTSCGILYRDSVFGLIYLGGKMKKENEQNIELFPADGQNHKIEIDCFRIRLSIETTKKNIKKLKINLQKGYIYIIFCENGEISEYTVNIREVQEKHLIVKETIKTIIKLEKER